MITMLKVILGFISVLSFASVAQSVRPKEIHGARVTFYDPDVNNAMEGGGKNRFGERINSVEDAIHNGKPVSIAADIYNDFGKTCNQKNRRCTVLVHIEGFDRVYPEYHKRFSRLPKNSFVGIVEDTGGAFMGTNGKRMDIAVRNRKLSNGAPSFLHSDAKWAKLDTPCGTGASSRECNVTSISVASSVAQVFDVEYN